ncbi:PAS domain S-box protein [Candidatus Gottesmanbacteria bacterium]|nr:PAS domain S-box protein [Candidatus Gottesmanbacteria bacterium]
MSIVDAIGSLFQSKSTSFGSPEDRAVQDLFGLVQSYINREDLVSHLDQRVKALILKKDAEERLDESIVLYRLYETFIVSNKPLVIKQEFSAESLRKTIADSFSVSTLPLELSLYFLPEEKRKLALVKIILMKLGAIIVRDIGSTKLQGMISQISRGNDHFPVQIEGDALVFIDVPTQALKNEDTASELLKVYAILIFDLENSMGKSSLDHELRDLLMVFQKRYEYELVQYFLDVTPQDFLVTERTNFTSSGMVKKQIEQATGEEKKKREESEKLMRELAQKMSEVEKQNTLLEETKKAMANILSDEQELEERLKTEKDRDEAILHSIGEGLFVADGTGRIILFNPVAEEFMGVKNADAIGKKIDDIWDVYKGGELLESLDRPVYQVISKQIRLTYDLKDELYFLPKRKKVRVPVAFSAAPVAGGKDAGAVVAFRDISDLVASRKALEDEKATVEKKVEERTQELKAKNDSLMKAQEQISEGWLSLQQEKARMNASINSLTLGYIMTDEDLNILTMNTAITSILGISKNTVNLHDIDVSFGDSLDLHAALEECRTKKESRSVTNIIFKKKYLRLFLAPILMDTLDKDLLGIVLLFEDITEARLVERSRDEFFSIASHELRTPLTAIRGNTAMIQDYFKDALKDQELNDMVKDIHESSVRLIDIVNDFLNMSRLELKKLEFKNDFFDVVGMAEDVIKELATTGSEHKLMLSVTKPIGNLPKAYADRDRVKEVLINLIGNSLKFTAEGGVTVSFVRDGESAVRVIVTDTGRGVAPENQALLFRKFQQASDNIFTRDTTKGTGLGLYISRLIIESMKGTIGLDKSEPGKGSVFSFTLPTEKY